MNVKIVRPIILFVIVFVFLFLVKRCMDWRSPQKAVPVASAKPEVAKPKVTPPPPKVEPPKVEKVVDSIATKVNKVEEKLVNYENGVVMTKLTVIEQKLDTLERRVSNLETYLPNASPVGDVSGSLNKKKGANMDWRKSVVDLMKILNIDHSEANRSKMAKDYGWDGKENMNDFLRKEIMKRLQTGEIKIP